MVSAKSPGFHVNVNMALSWCICVNDKLLPDFFDLAYFQESNNWQHKTGIFGDYIIKYSTTYGKNTLRIMNLHI